MRQQPETEFDFKEAMKLLDLKWSSLTIGGAAAAAEFFSQNPNKAGPDVASPSVAESEAIPQPQELAEVVKNVVAMPESELASMDPDFKQTDKSPGTPQSEKPDESSIPQKELQRVMACMEVAGAIASRAAISAFVGVVGAAAGPFAGSLAAGVAPILADGIAADLKPAVIEATKQAANALKEASADIGAVAKSKLTGTTEYTMSVGNALVKMFRALAVVFKDIAPSVADRFRNVANSIQTKVAILKEATRHVGTRAGLGAATAVLSVAKHVPIARKHAKSPLARIGQKSEEETGRHAEKLESISKHRHEHIQHLAARAGHRSANRKKLHQAVADIKGSWRGKVRSSQAVGQGQATTRE